MSEIAFWATVVGRKVRKKAAADIEKYVDMCIME
jgi:hypothetical protein